MTTPEDTERWADAQTPRYSNVRQFNGLDYQGRHPQAAEPCSDFLADAPEDEPMWASWWDDVRFLLAVSSATAAVCLLLFLWRGA